MLSFAINFCYILFPAALWFGNIFSFDFPRLTFEIVMVLLMVFSSLRILLTRRPVSKYLIEPTIILLILIFLAVTKITPYVFGSDLNWLNYLMEMKPVFYLTCAVILFSQHSERKCIEKSIVDGSIFLSVLVLIDFFVRGYLSGSFGRAIFSGEVNYEAVLLAIGFVVSLDKKSPVSILIFIGIAATMSRTVLIAMPFLYFIVARPGFFKTSVVSVVVCIPIIFSFLTRGLAIELETIDRFWMWSAAIEMFFKYPSGFLFGFQLHEGLPLIVPEKLAGLHQMQMETKNDMGFFAFSLHSFWLRAVSTWGILLVSGAFLVLLFKIVKCKSSVGLALYFLMVMAGLTMGTFYLGHVSIIVLLMFLNILYGNSNGRYYSSDSDFQRRETYS